jgi:hypothetical protein
VSLAAGMDAYCERCGSPSHASDGTGTDDQRAGARNVPGLDWTRRLRKGGASAAPEFQLRLCLTCRGYACAACWNDDAGACQMCVALPEAAVAPAIAVAAPIEPDAAGDDDVRSLIAWPAPDFGAPPPAGETAPGPAEVSAVATPDRLADLPIAPELTVTTPVDLAAQPAPEDPDILNSSPDVTSTASPVAGGGWLRRTFGRATAVTEPPTDGMIGTPAQPSGPEVEPTVDTEPEAQAGAYATHDTEADPAAFQGTDADLDALLAAVAAFPIDALPADAAHVAEAQPATSVSAGREPEPRLLVEPPRPPAEEPPRPPAEEPPTVLEEDATEDVSAEDPTAGDVPLGVEDVVVEHVAEGEAGVVEPSIDGEKAATDQSTPTEDSSAPYLSFVVAPDRLGPADVPYGRVVEVRELAEPPSSTRACRNCELPLSALVRYCRRCGSRQPDMAQIAG